MSSFGSSVYSVYKVIIIIIHKTDINSVFRLTEDFPEKTWRRCWIIILSGLTVLGLILETIRYRLSKVVSTHHVELKSSFQK